MAAPVCHIPPENVNIPQPGSNRPQIPPAAQPNIASLVATVNGLRELIIKQQGDQTTIINNFGTKGNKEQGDWNEVRRTTEQVKVYNPDDNSQYITVERINKLEMGNKKSGEKWVWTR